MHIPVGNPQFCSIASIGYLFYDLHHCDKRQSKGSERPQAGQGDHQGNDHGSYEEVALNQQAELAPSIIFTRDNIAYGCVPKI